jgi:hypothetical protein
MDFIVPLLLSVTLLSVSCFLLVGLISVPWPVLVMVLVSGLLLTQRVLRVSQADLESLLLGARDRSFRD